MMQKIREGACMGQQSIKSLQARAWGSHLSSHRPTTPHNPLLASDSGHGPSPIVSIFRSFTHRCIAQNALLLQIQDGPFNFPCLLCFFFFIRTSVRFSYCFIASLLPLSRPLLSFQLQGTRDMTEMYLSSEWCLSMLLETKIS